MLRRIDAAGLDTSARLAAGMGTHQVQQFLRDEVAALSQVEIAGIVGADGKLINTSREWPVPDVTLASSEYFKALREKDRAPGTGQISAPPAGAPFDDNPTAGLWISDPTLVSSTGRPAIFLSRRIEGPGGKFLGVVVVGIKLDYFRDFYRAVSEGDEQLVALLRLDGTVLARYPVVVRPIAVIPATDALVRAMQRGDRSARTLSRSPTDGILRVRVAHAVDGFPLDVVIARTEASILASWRSQSLGIAAGTLIAAVAFVVAISLLARQIARRETSEAALAATLEHMNQGIVMIEPDGRVPVHNRRMLEMLDIPAEMMAGIPHYPDILSYLWQRGEFGQDGASVEGDVRQMLRSDGLSAKTGTYERRRPNGTRLEISNVLLPGGGTVRSFTDVTVAREREAALAAALTERDKAKADLPRQRDDINREMEERSRPLIASEALHRDVSEVASDWIWETNPETRLTFVSKRFGDTSGISWADVAGHEIQDLIALGFDRGGMDQLRATIDAREVFQDAVYRVVTAGGDVRFWRMAGKPYFDPVTGIFAGYRGTGTDVTATTEREAALNGALVRAEAAELNARQAGTRLADAIKAIPEGFVLHDAEDRLVLCNTRYGEMYGLSVEQMTPGARFEDALRATFESGGHAVDAPEIEAALADRLRRHRSESGNHEEYRLADGRWLEVYEHRTSDGGTVGIRIDTTAARQREGAEREREKLAALGHLAGGVAHEINNLLQPALVFPALVRDRLPEDDLKSREDLDCVLDGVRKVREIVRNILLFARREEPSLTKLDLVVELRSALGFVRDLMPPAVTVREQDLEAHAGCLVAVNKTQLTQVLTNLLVNAAQATVGSGTITVSVARIDPTEDEAAALSIEPRRHYLAVSVADTGTGMDETTQRRIFEPFFTTKPVGQGTGLGLSVVHGILRSWHGAITVRGVVGVGSTFTLHIPVALEDAG